MLRLPKVEIIALLFFILIVAGLAVLTAPLPALRLMSIPWTLASAGLFAGSLCAWSAVWVFFLRCACSLSPAEAQETDGSRAALSAAHGTRPPCVRSFSLSMASLSGLLTPMNIGADALRSLFGRRFLGLPLNLTATASVLTRIAKVQVTLCLIAFAVVLFTRTQPDYRKAFVVPAAGSVLLLVLLYLMTTSSSRRLSQRLKIGDLSTPVQAVRRKLDIARRSFVYLMMILQYALEWQALYACLLALEIKIPLMTSFILYIILYFLSRTPFVPQGLGVVEAGGYAFLRTMNVPEAQTGALLVVWGFLRILIPLVVSAAFSIELMMTVTNRKGRIRCPQAGTPS